MYIFIHIYIYIYIYYIYITKGPHFLSMVHQAANTNFVEIDFYSEQFDIAKARSRPTGLHYISLHYYTTDRTTKLPQLPIHDPR
jgi:hypothetical protein